MLFITLSRQTGSYGKEIAELASQELALPIITREMAMLKWFPEVATAHEMHMLAESPAFFLNPCRLGISFSAFLENKLKEFVASQPAIILGLGGQIIFADDPSALHVKVTASQDVRIARIMQAYHLQNDDAARFLDLADRKHKKYISVLYEKDWAAPSLYHLNMNTDLLSIEGGASLLCHMYRHEEVFARTVPELPAEKDKRTGFFRHPSEEEFARILDMNQIEWQYEPRTFPIKWDAEGNITLAFTPDFYLPRFNTYIELTTMNQKYASEKKKKVQLLKDLYPNTNISIVFKNDFKTLIERFGLQEGSGS